MSTLSYIVLFLKWLIPSILIYKLNNQKMRYIDTYEPSTKQDIIIKSIMFAKAEIAELNLPATTNVHELALDYCHQVGCIMGDMLPYDPINIVAWVGAKPVKIPR